MENSTYKGISIRHLGQSGFELCGEGINIVIDPYLSYSVDDGDKWIRKYAPPVLPDELIEVDFVLLSHDHLDHVDPETLQGICKASPKSQFAASAWYAMKRLTEIGIPADRIIPLETDVTVSLSDTVKLTPIPAAHEELHSCTPGGYKEIGFIVDFNGKRVYHGGDTCVYDGLKDRISGVDIGILPVNGRDEMRRKMNCIGNMNIREAVQLAKDAGIECTVPCHWDLYDLNGETVDNIHAAFNECPDIKYLLFQGGVLKI